MWRESKSECLIKIFALAKSTLEPKVRNTKIKKYRFDKRFVSKIQANIRSN